MYCYFFLVVPDGTCIVYSYLRLSLTYRYTKRSSSQTKTLKRLHQFKLLYCLDCGGLFGMVHVRYTSFIIPWRKITHEYCIHIQYVLEGYKDRLVQA